MGLDNIPKTYPCVLEKTAIYNDSKQIDCKATQGAGKCPYKREFESDPLVKDTTPVYGMFGTDCWYRGKYGNHLLSILDVAANEYMESGYGIDFYGNGFGDGEEGINVDDCLKMHRFFIDHVEEFTYQATQQYGKDEVEPLVKDWIYAAWWLKFIGNYGEGSGIWY